MILSILAGFILLSITGCQKQVPPEIDNSSVENSQNIEKHSTNESNTNSDNSLIDIIVDESTITADHSKENEVVKYFEDLEAEINYYINKANFYKLKKKAKNIAIIGIDFIFYGTEIKGVTFEELTTETKQKIMSIVASIDTKIEAKIPGYKETIKDKFGQGYSYVTEKLQEEINYIDNKLDEKYGQQYQNTKDKTTEIKRNIKEGALNVFDKISEETNQGWNKIKDWYEEKTGK